MFVLINGKYSKNVVLIECNITCSDIVFTIQSIGLSLQINTQISVWEYEGHSDQKIL